MAKTTGIAAFSEGRSDVHRVDPRKLFIKSGWNMREESEELTAHIDMLAQSIAEVGVKEPISVKLDDGKLWVTNGHCRTRASIIAIEKYGAELKTVPVISEGQYVNDADLIFSQIVRNSGKPLSIMEMAKVFQKLLAMGWDQSNIAKKSGMSGGRVSQILDYLTMPADVQASVVAGHVSPSLAMATVKAAESPAAASETVAKAVKAATKEGRKVKPSDTGSSTQQAKTVLKDAIDNSDVDNSDPDSQFVVIKMPIDDWEKVVKLLGI